MKNHSSRHSAADVSDRVARARPTCRCYAARVAAARARAPLHSRSYESSSKPAAVPFSYFRPECRLRHTPPPPHPASSYSRKTYRQDYSFFFARQPTRKLDATLQPRARSRPSYRHFFNFSPSSSIRHSPILNANSTCFRKFLSFLIIGRNNILYNELSLIHI